MELSDKNNLLILVGLVAVIAEIILGAATGFDLLLLGIIFMVSGAVGILFQSFNTALVVVFSLSLLYILFGRKFIKSRLTIETKKTNIDSIMKKKGMVIQPITSTSAGQIKIEGEIWRAVSDVPVETGEEVSIESVSGVTLRVKKV